MHREYHKWYSPILHRDMELALYGHAGARVFVFPCSRGKYWDWEDRGVVAALGHHLHNGWVQLYCLDSVDGESWYAYHRPRGDRMRRNTEYYEYILNEVYPLSRHKNSSPFTIVTGASMGGYHAINFALRYPQCVGRVIDMSGLCDMKRFMEGGYDSEFYYHNPVDYLPNENDHHRIELMKRMDIIFSIGRDDPALESNKRLSGQLWAKGIGNALRIWDGFAHDWPWWQKMILNYIGGHD
jgi:esterase/lipase superfamily enzyme